MMKKLDKEGVFRELREKRFFKSKPQKRREKQAMEIRRQRKEQRKRDETFEKLESRAIIDSKKRAREYKQKQKDKLK